MTSHEELVLGSTSPRRKEIMQFFSYPFKQVAPSFDEAIIPFTGDPTEYVTTLAQGKARSLEAPFPDSIIVTCDTIVFIDNEVLGKPKDEKEAFRMLAKLSGRWHSVFTAIAVLKHNRLLSAVSETKVHCNTLSQEDIHRYYRAHSLADKAGSYAIQRSGSLLVKEIVGCYYNVMGLPIDTLRSLLQQVGIDLWDYLKPF
jgi:septum formation protein